MARLLPLLLLAGLLVFSRLPTPACSCPAPCQCFGNTTVFCSEECMAEFAQGVPSGAARPLFVETLLGPVLSEAFANYSRSLRKLVFLCSPIGRLGKGAFEGLPKLRELEISNSQLSNLTGDVFLGLDQLSKLSIKFSLLETLGGGGGGPQLFQNTPSLRALQLQGNKIHSLPPDTFRPVGQLESLSLAGNCLAELPGRVFEPLTLLQVLKLSDNRLSLLPPGLFQPLRSSLQELHLEGNALPLLPPGLLTPLSRLRRLHLQHNALVHLPPAAFSSLSRLVFLHLDHNWLKELPAGLFQGTRELTELSLAHNRLESLPEGLFGHLPNLAVLLLSHNRLGHLPAGAFAGLPALARLQLSHNNLSTLPREALADLTSLELLDLAHNQLATLPEGLFDSNEALFSVALKGNPWACDCHLGYLAGWLQDTDALFNAQALCRSPAHLQGLSLPGVQKGQLVCPPLPPGPAPCLGEAQAPPGELSSSSSQCLYQDPGGALRLLCHPPELCHRLVLQLPPGQGFPGEGQHFSRAWTLASDCGPLRVQVSILVEKEKPPRGGGGGEAATARPASRDFP